MVQELSFSDGTAAKDGCSHEATTIALPSSIGRRSGLPAVPIHCNTNGSRTRPVEHKYGPDTTQRSATGMKLFLPS